MIKKILLFGLVLAIVSGGYAYWVFNKPHEDIRKKKPVASYTSEALILEFVEDHGNTDARLVDKVITIEGKINKVKTDSEQSVFTFDHGHDYIIQAYLPAEGNSLSALDQGSNVRLKCKYSGYLINDEDFMIPADIKVEKCYIELN